MEKTMKSHKANNSHEELVNTYHVDHKHNETNEVILRETMISEPKLIEHLEKEDNKELQEMEKIKKHMIEEERIKNEKAQKLLSERAENELLFCLSVDGSEHSEFAFQFLESEVFNFIDGNHVKIPNKYKLLITHIYNSEMDDIYNYRNKKETIIDKYNTLMMNKFHIERTVFYTEDRDKECVHALEQVNKVAYKARANFLFCGYYGIKGPRGDNKELSRGVDFLLGNSRIPTVIIKEKASRKIKGGFKWLFAFDRISSNCFRTFNSFLPLIDFKRDYIYGFTLLPHYVNFDDVKKDFMTKMDEYGVDPERYSYEQVEYSKSSANLITDKINFGEIIFDFLVYYNNPEKHKSEGPNSEAANIVKRSNCNICFYNGGITHFEINYTPYNFKII